MLSIIVQLVGLISKIVSYFSEGLRLNCVGHVTVQRCYNEENGHRRNGVHQQLRERVRKVWSDRVLIGVRAVRSSGLQGTGSRDGDLENEDQYRQSFGTEGHYVLFHDEPRTTGSEEGGYGTSS